VEVCFDAVFLSFELMAMSKYKALITDYDGTLAETTYEGDLVLPSINVIESLVKARKFIRVNLATARPLIAIKPFLEICPLNGYVILVNGAQIVEVGNMKTVIKRTLNRQSLKTIVELCKDWEIEYVYANNFEKDIKIDNFEKLPDDDIADVYFDGIDLKTAGGIEQKLKAVAEVAVHRILLKDEGKIGLDVTNSKATKQVAIHEVAKLLGVTHDEMIGVGDGPNDMPLLMACGLKVAMGNAVEELKDIADFVASSVKEDGMVEVINKFVLG